MNSEWATARAAENNAAWCERVCRAHGIPGVFHEHYWLNAARVPPSYPNMVTLSGSRSAAEAQRVRAAQAVAAAEPFAWSVKDSFGSLALDGLGFDRLFESHWIWSETLPRAEEPVAGTSWVRVTGAAEWARWESAWAGSPVRAGKGRMFPDSLLGQPAVAVVAALRDGNVVGGALANFACGVVGLSNLFGLPREPEALWGGVVATVAAAFPGIPLVGYEHGLALAHAKAAGFEALSPLTVWVRPA